MVDTPFPAANQSRDATRAQARDLVAVLAIAGYDRETARTVCRMMIVEINGLSPVEFTALAQGMSLKRD